MTFVQKCTKECTKFVQNGFLITEDMSSLVFCVFIVVVEWLLCLCEQHWVAVLLAEKCTEHMYTHQHEKRNRMKEQTNKWMNKRKEKKVDKKTQITCQNDCPECQVGIDSLTYILWNAHGWDRDEKFNWLSFIARWQIRSIFSLLPLISIGSDNQRISLLTEALTILHHSVNRRSENCASPGQQKHQNLCISLSTGDWKTASPSSQEH